MMPGLVRLYIQSAALGFLISAIFTAGLIWLDVAGLGHLISASDIGWIAALTLVFLNVMVFAAVQFAFRVTGMAAAGQGPKGGQGEILPARVPARR